MFKTNYTFVNRQLWNFVAWAARWAYFPIWSSLYSTIVIIIYTKPPTKVDRTKLGVLLRLSPWQSAATRHEVVFALTFLVYLILPPPVPINKAPTSRAPSIFLDSTIEYFRRIRKRNRYAGQHNYKLSCNRAKDRRIASLVRKLGCCARMTHHFSFNCSALLQLHQHYTVQAAQVRCTPQNSLLTCPCEQKTEIRLSLTRLLPTNFVLHWMRFLHFVKIVEMRSSPIRKKHTCSPQRRRRMTYFERNLISLFFKNVNNIVTIKRKLQRSIENVAVCTNIGNSRT